MVSSELLDEPIHLFENIFDLEVGVGGWELHFYNEAINFVDEDDDGNPLLYGSLDDSLGAHHHTFDGINHYEGGVTCTESAGNFVEEVDVPWRIIKVEEVALVFGIWEDETHGR